MFPYDVFPSVCTGKATEVLTMQNYSEIVCTRKTKKY